MIFRPFLIATVAVVLCSAVIIAVSPRVRFIVLVSLFGSGDNHKPIPGKYQVIDALSDTDLILYHIDNSKYVASIENPIWRQALIDTKNAKIRAESARIIIGIYNLNSGSYEDAIELTRDEYIRGTNTTLKYYAKLIRSPDSKNGIDWSF